MPRIDAFLEIGKQQGGSDIHFTVGLPPLVRLDGELLPIKLRQEARDVLALGLIWNSYFPLNKALWTSSYVFATTGLALLVLSSCYWLIDIKGYDRWAWPFKVFGANALSSALSNSSANTNTVAILNMAVAAPPTQADVQTLANKVDELILALRRT